MVRLSASRLILLVGLFFFAGNRVAVSADTGFLKVSARDSVTGHGLAATLTVFQPLDVTIEDPPKRILAARTLHIADWRISGNRADVGLAAGLYVVEARAARRVKLRTYFQVEPSERLLVTFWLDLETAQSPPMPRHALSPRTPNETSLTGHVFEAGTGQPLAGARVSLQGVGLETETDGNGHFFISAPTVTLRAEDLPEADELLIELPGFKSFASRVQLASGGRQFIIDLQRGDGVAARLEEQSPHADIGEPAEVLSSLVAAEETTPPSFRGAPPPRSLRDSPPARAALGLRAPVSSPSTDVALVSPLNLPSGLPPQSSLLVKNPPGTIRVLCGLRCKPTSDDPDEVDVVGLETYVKRGLDNEWFDSSWGDHSFRSGAVAFRSYGASYVDEPDRPQKGSYDIDSTGNRQRYDRRTSEKQSRAVEATSGILLEKDSGIFRAFHSAEANSVEDPSGERLCQNPDLSCRDGFAGSPSQAWPCLKDELCKASSQPDPTEFYCLGHGLGMCQVGTARWDAWRGKLWNWIVDHYYNDNGPGKGQRSAHMTSPIGLLQAKPDPELLVAGNDFTIQMRLINYAEVAHDQVMITASLFSQTTEYISDPAHDTKVRLGPGTNDVSRSFTVTPETPPGRYDLIVTLWLDVNADGRVSAPPENREGEYDLPLFSRTYDRAIEVVDSPAIRPFIWYRFNQGDLAGRTVRNWGPPELSGAIVGPFTLVPGASGNAIHLDGETTHVEVNNSRALSFQGGVELEAFVWRAANTDEDAVASKWYGAQDQWILTFYPVGPGLLIFSVRLQNGSYASVEYPIPNASYLRTWVRVGAAYVPGAGLRLFWNGRLVAERHLPSVAVVSGSQPIHIGDAGPGTSWSRFRGRIDEVRIRVPRQ